MVDHQNITFSDILDMNQNQLASVFGEFGDEIQFAIQSLKTSPNDTDCISTQKTQFSSKKFNQVSFPESLSFLNRFNLTFEFRRNLKGKLNEIDTIEHQIAGITHLVSTQKTQFSSKKLNEVIQQTIFPVCVLILTQEAQLPSKKSNEQTLNPVQILINSQLIILISQTFSAAEQEVAGLPAKDVSPLAVGNSFQLATIENLCPRLIDVLTMTSEVNLRVAAPVTPPLSLMCETFSQSCSDFWDSNHAD